MVIARSPSNMVRKWIHFTRKGDNREMGLEERRGLESLSERVTSQQSLQKLADPQDGEGSMGTKSKWTSMKADGCKCRERYGSSCFLDLGTEEVRELYSLQHLPFSSKKLQTCALQTICGSRHVVFKL